MVDFSLICLMTGGYPFIHLPKGHHAYFHDPVEPSGQPARSACSVKHMLPRIPGRVQGIGARTCRSAKCCTKCLYFSFLWEPRIVKCRTSFPEYVGFIKLISCFMVNIEDGRLDQTPKGPAKTPQQNFQTDLASCQAFRIPFHFVWKPGNDAGYRWKGWNWETIKKHTGVTEITPDYDKPW
jgi:hypothetical protein